MNTSNSSYLHFLLLHTQRLQRCLELIVILRYAGNHGIVYFGAPRAQNRVRTENAQVSFFAQASEVTTPVAPIEYKEEALELPDNDSYTQLSLENLQFDLEPEKEFSKPLIS